MVVCKDSTLEDMVLMETVDVETVDVATGVLEDTSEDESGTEDVVEATDTGVVVELAGGVGAGVSAGESTE